MSNESFGECIERAQRKHLFTTELEALDQLLDDVTARRSHMRESIDVHSKEISSIIIINITIVVITNPFFLCDPSNKAFQQQRCALARFFIFILPLFFFIFAVEDRLLHR